MFSGGLDCMVLAALAHRHAPPHEPIDLINVCFAPDHDSPDRQTAVLGLRELTRAFPARDWQLLCVDESCEAAYGAQLGTARLLAPRLTHMDFSIGTALCYAARGVGFVDIEIVNALSCPRVALSCPRVEISAHHARRGHVGAGSNLSEFDAPPPQPGKGKGKGPRGEAARRCRSGGGGDTAPAKAHPTAVLGTGEADGDAALACSEGGAGRDEGVARLVSHAGRDEGVATASSASCQSHAAVARLVSRERLAAALLQDDAAAAEEEEGEEGEGEGPVGCAAAAAVGPVVDPRCLEPAEAQAGALVVELGLGPLLETYRRVFEAAAGAGAGEAAGSAFTAPEPTVSQGLGAATEAHPQLPPRSGAAAAALSDDDSATATPLSPPPLRLRVLVRSRARVLLSGLGADEQLAGYARHRTAWARGGWARLAAELDADTRRLWLRNLGRDDRLCADAARELRLPYLDERVVAAVRTLPLPALADLRLPFGVGDKRALRVAAQLLGLPGAAGMVKRAIHFGSRIAKQSNQRAFGSNSKGRGDAPFAFAFAPGAAAGGAAGTTSSAAVVPEAALALAAVLAGSDAADDGGAVE